MPYRSELLVVRDGTWVTAPVSYVAAQIDLESGWNTKAHLHTSREDGYGLPQTTIAYDSHHKARFNVFQDLNRRYPGKFVGYQEHPYDVKFGLSAVLLTDHTNWDYLGFFGDSLSRLAGALTAYNCGVGRIQSDHRLCVQMHHGNCDKWYGGVAETSKLSRKSLGKAYGRSPFGINRAYFHDIQAREPGFRKYLVR